jgi:elongation factor P
MYDTADFRNGLKIEVEGAPHVIIEFQHVKPGKGGAFVRTRLRNLLTRAVIDRTFKAGEKFPRPDLSRRRLQYLYKEGAEWCFMDSESFDQIYLTADVLGDAAKWLQENVEVDALFYEGRVIDMELPVTVDLRVEDCPPPHKGDTAAGSGKPATLETGAVVNVPYFINPGDVLRIDTRTGKYVERV